MRVRRRTVTSARFLGAVLTLGLALGPGPGIGIHHRLEAGWGWGKGAATARAAAADRIDLVTLPIAAAISLRPALDELVRAFEEAHPVRLSVHFASSGTLRHQIEWGAPLDLLIAVTSEPVLALIQKGLVEEVGEPLATNRLVLVRPAGRAWPLTWDDLLSAGRRRLAIGDPAHVPLGWFAQIALQESGLWQDLQSNLILGGDARQVVTYVQLKAVDAAIVYESDVITAGLESVTVVPEHLYPPIRYSTLLVNRPRTTEQELALRSLVEFLSGDMAREIIAKHGLGGGR